MSTAIQETTQASEQPWPSRARAWYAVFVFMIVLMFAVIDRQIITLLVGPIKRDLDIGDTQMSLLMGFAFVMFNLVMGMPIARLADVRSRRLIIGIGVALWSAMTAACGLAQHYWQLFAARVGVGVGEACNAPATFSMLSDYFPRHKLAKAASVLTIGFFAGAGLALIVGGHVVHLVHELPDVDLPLLGRMRPWQITFIVVGLPGLLVALLLATVQEPKRRGMTPSHRASGSGDVATPVEDAGKAASVPIKDIFRYQLSQWQTYGPMYGGMALRVMVAFGAAVWLPTFFERTYGWTIAQVGLALGVTLLTVSPLGLLAGGFLAEWFATQGRHDANMRVYLISTMAVVPTSVLYPLMTGPWLALVLFAANSFFSSLGAGPANAALQTVTPNPMRAQVTAMYIFVFNLVGFGLGPITIAVLTDYVFGAESHLRYSLTSCAAVVGTTAALIVWFGLRPYRDSVIRAKDWV